MEEESVISCVSDMGEESLEEVREFKYFRVILDKFGDTEGESSTG